MSWNYNYQPVIDLPDDCVGFVYVITNMTNGRMYVGKKLAKFSKTKYRVKKLKNGTKKKVKIRELIDSDWRDYWGSSKELGQDIQSMGATHFRRDILYFCKSKAECSYLEAKEQMIRGVLESDRYYNNAIQIRVHGSHIKGKL